MSMSAEDIGRIEMSLPWKRLDVGVFGLLILSLMLYQIQHLVPQFALFHVREVLYLYLYARVLFFYQVRLTKPFVALLLYLSATCLVAFHTYYLAGLAVAVPGFTRFVHLSLAAPLAAVLLDKDADIRAMLYLWMGVVTAGIMTVAYQMLGGEMPWLVQNYIAIRGDLVRHKSLMGEPNVGGISAALLYLLASTIVTKATVRYFLLFASSFLVLASISKAAVVGFLFVNFVIVIEDYRATRITGFGFPSRRLCLQTMAVLGWILMLALNPLLYQYMTVGFNSFVGNQLAVPGAVEDFGDRFVFSQYGGSIFDFNAFTNSLAAFQLTGGDLSVLSTFVNNLSAFFSYLGAVFLDLVPVMFGQSFTRAGSAAIELKIPNAAGPHNMYLEVFLVGGLMLTVALVVVQALTIKTLIRQRATNSGLYKVLLPLLVLISLYMTGYPNIYEPITGTLFWLIVGISCSCYSKAQCKENEFPRSKNLLF